MTYDFDQVIDRRGTNCLKYEFAVERGKPAGVLPLWVADMDFPAPPAVLDAIHRMADHGIFGYSEVKGAYCRAVASWFERRFGWRPEEDWLVKTPGVVFALAMGVRALSNPGDSVLLTPPIYYPFYQVIRDNGRRVVESEMIYKDGRYFIDFADFERKIVENDVRLFLMCSPHNPIGRVWTREELAEIGRICKRHGVYVMSDEVHCDFAFPEHPHTPFLQAAPEMAELTVLCTAPSKTFNLAGLQVSNNWIPSAKVRERFRREIDACGYSQHNAVGLVACQAAYEGGEEWFEQCRAYLRGNLDFFREYLEKNLPQLKLVEPDGTYFAWVDCSALGLPQPELDDLILKKAGLWLDAGHIFGKSGEQFQRFVLACPRATLAKALDRLKSAVG